MLQRTLKKDMVPVVNASDNHAALMADLLESVTAVHKIHLKITGPGSFAAHKAMNEFYDEVGDLADGIIESYQGVTEKLVDLSGGEQPKLNNVDDCLGYMRKLYAKVNAVQSGCPYSEINNDLDNVKTLINSTKYKLIFLK